MDKRPRLWHGTHVEAVKTELVGSEYVTAHGLLLSIDWPTSTIQPHDMGKEVTVNTGSLNVVNEDEVFLVQAREELHTNRRRTYARLGNRLRRAPIIVHDENDIPKPGVFISISPDDPTRVVAIRIGDEAPSTWDAGLVEITSFARLENERARLEALIASHCR